MGMEEFKVCRLNCLNSCALLRGGQLLKLKRVYEAPKREDGERILVERLWPRGLTKERAAIDLWLKNIAPSLELRKWFGHDAGRWNDFRKRYWAELRKNKESVDLIKQKSGDKTVTLVYAAGDKEHNSALALKSYLERRKSAA